MLHCGRPARDRCQLKPPGGRVPHKSLGEPPPLLLIGGACMLGSQMSSSWGPIDAVSQTRGPASIQGHGGAPEAAVQGGAVVLRSAPQSSSPHAQPDRCNAPVLSIGPKRGWVQAQGHPQHRSKPTGTAACAPPAAAARDARLNLCPAALHERPGPGARRPRHSASFTQPLGMAGARNACRRRGVHYGSPCPQSGKCATSAFTRPPSAPPSFCGAYIAHEALLCHHSLCCQPAAPSPRLTASP